MRPWGLSERPSKHVDPTLRLISAGLGRVVLGELRSRYPKSWARVAAQSLRAPADPHEIETRVVRDAHAALKLMLAQWDELFADRLGERERAWTLELLATRHAWAHLEEISTRDVLRILDIGELLLAALDAPEAQGVRRLRAGVARRRGMRRMLASAAAGAMATLMVLALALLWLGRDDARALPSSLAGPWPGQWESDVAFAANLTQRIPFDIGTIAVRGDVLLVRTRLVVRPGRRPVRAVYSLTIPPRADRWSMVEVSLAASPQPGDARELAVTMGPALRLRLVPGSTRLLDADGRELADPPDPSPRGGVPISGLEGGGVYYVESRLRAASPPAGAKGQISAEDLFECRGDHGRAEGPVTDPESPLLCRARLSNLGRRTLETVLTRLSYTPDGRMASLVATASAADARPSTTRLAAIAMLRRGRIEGVEYVPRSARLLTASHEPIGTFSGNPFRRALNIGELRPGTAHARYLEFAIRLR